MTCRLNLALKNFRYSNTKINFAATVSPQAKLVSYDIGLSQIRAVGERNQPNYN